MLSLERSLTKVRFHCREVTLTQGKLSSRRRKLWEEGRELEPGSGTRPGQGPAKVVWPILGEPKVGSSTWSLEKKKSAVRMALEGDARSGQGLRSHEKDFCLSPHSNGNPEIASASGNLIDPERRFQGSPRMRRAILKGQAHSQVVDSLTVVLAMDQE